MIKKALRVYPACAGIDLIRIAKTHPVACLPRMRGDRPSMVSPPSNQAQFTPHARGSTQELYRKQKKQAVYPACAGIDLSYMCSMASCRCLPRMRGDRPPKKKPGMQGTEFTPHARGSTFDCLI